MTYPEKLMSRPSWVVGGLIAHVINNLLHDPPPDHAGSGEWEAYGCCPVCCAPCRSLKWLRENAPTVTGAAVRAAVHDGWDWQLEGGDINWDVITERWKEADNYGCHDPEPCELQVLA